jgi:hypothetical protein
MLRYRSRTLDWMGWVMRRSTLQRLASVVPRCYGLGDWDIPAGRPRFISSPRSRMTTPSLPFSLSTPSPLSPSSYCRRAMILIHLLRFLRVILSRSFSRSTQPFPVYTSPVITPYPSHFLTYPPPSRLASPAPAAPTLIRLARSTTTPPPCSPPNSSSSKPKTPPSPSSSTSTPPAGASRPVWQSTIRCSTSRRPFILSVSAWRRVWGVCCLLEESRGIGMR